MDVNVDPAGVLDRPAPTLAQAFKVWLRIGLLSFGGPAAQIALMHREIVDDNRWLGEQQFLNALSFCMLLPGPEAMQLATYAGWRLHGTLGGIVAGLLFVLPGALVIVVLASVYAWYGNVPLVEALFTGVKAAVIVIVIEALFRVARRALGSRVHWLIAGAAFIAIFFLALPFPLIVFAAGVFGYLHAGRQDDAAVHHAMVPPARTLRTAATWLAIWWLPLLSLHLWADEELLFQLGVFFSKLAVVTFGGAYAVLAYLGQNVVGEFGWLSAGDIMDGLGLAETTPGPLILVNEFVGFLAGFHQGGIALALSGAAVTLWATFAPCFLWIFTGAPYIEWISGQSRLKGALQSITAAVVGVILNLSIWFALHVFFADVARTVLGPFTLWLPDFATVDFRALLLTAACAVLLFRYRFGLIRVLALAALGGLVLGSG